MRMSSSFLGSSESMCLTTSGWSCGALRRPISRPSLSNKRLKLPAPGRDGRIPFVIDHFVRRSLSAIR